jgi:serine-type D-Ala-D-Ala carboxypeptidase (penicillin-binding protein 5/6)
LVAAKSASGGDAAPGTSTNAAGFVPSADALPVRVGVAVIGTVIVFGLIMAARSMNRRPQN